MKATHQHMALLGALLLLMMMAGCQFDLNNYSHSLTGSSQVRITTGDGLVIQGTASQMRVKDSAEQPAPRNLVLKLGSSSGRGEFGELWMALDAPPDRVGHREVLRAMLHLATHPNQEVNLPAPGWSSNATVEVKEVVETEMPAKEDRSCTSYPTRMAKVSVALDATGPAGERFKIHPIEMVLYWSYDCEEFHM